MEEIQEVNVVGDDLEEIVPNEEEYLRALLKRLSGDEYQRIVRLPDNRLLALPVVLKLYVHGYGVDEISRLTGIPQRKVQKMVQTALRVSVLDEVGDIRREIIMRLRKFQQAIADKAISNPSWGRLYLEAMRLQIEASGGIHGKAHQMPALVQQIIVNQDKNSPVDPAPVVEIEPVYEDKVDKDSE